MWISEESGIHSFRDPMGKVIIIDGKVFRIINKLYESQVIDFLESNFFSRQCNNGVMPITSIHRDSLKDENSDMVLEHEPISFPLYPHEWTPSMLFDAGIFTLKIAEDALSSGMIMKDATPWNVLFSEGRFIFCDVLSFEPWIGSKIWIAYAQFQRAFILPLYAKKIHGWPVHLTFIDKRDGIDPSYLYPVTKGFRRWMPLELNLITLPVKLYKVFSLKKKRSVNNAVVKQKKTNIQAAIFVINSCFKRLANQLNAVKPLGGGNTKWAFYEDDLKHYSSLEHQEKLNFVSSGLLRAGKGRVLDMGANAGEYSLLAASQGNSVVAADSDVVALEKLYARVKEKGLPISPVVFNIARPTPSIGWNNNEIDSFLSRSRGQFNVLMVLALLHHLLVTERIPLEFIIKLLYDFEAPFLIVEWVNPDDLRFKEIAQMHGDIYDKLSAVVFEAKLGEYFNVIERLPLDGKTRILYLCRRRIV